MATETQTYRHIPVRDILAFQDEQACWGDQAVTFHRPTCTYASSDNSGTFRLAVLELLTPCAVCWKGISPGRFHRLTNGLLYVEREGVSVEDLVEAPGV